MGLNKRFCRLRAVLALLLVAVTLVALAPVSAQAEDDSWVSYHEYTEEEENEALSHARVGVLLGSLVELEAEGQFPDAEIVTYQSEPDIIAALSGGRLDYGIVSELYAIRLMESTPGYEYMLPHYYAYHDCFVLAKDRTELRDKINEILARFREDGTYDAIQKKWEVDRNYTLDDVHVREDGEVLRVVFTGSDEPYSFVTSDGLVGSAVEMAMRIGYELGMRVETQVLPFGGMIAAVSSGNVDMAAQLSYTDERAKEILFTDPYVDINNGAVAVVEDSESFGFFESLVRNFRSSFIKEDRWQLVLSGLGVTAIAAGCSFVLATVLGVVLCLLLRSPKLPLRKVAGAYVQLASGVPVLVWLLVLYYVVFSNLGTPGIVVAVTCFGLQGAAGMADIFETGLDAVDAGQVEAAHAMGFSSGETFRLIVLPQAAERVWGLYVGELGGIIKETSIVGYVAIQDLTRVSDIIRSRTFQAFFPLVATALIYFALIAACTWLLVRLGRLLEPKRRSRAKVLKGLAAQ